MVGTHITDMYEWLACRALRYDSKFAFYYLQTAHFYQLWKLNMYPGFQRKAFPMKIETFKTQATSNRFFHRKCFLTSDSHHIFCYIWKHKNNLIITINIMKSPILNLLRPSCGLQRISPHIISMISSRQVMRVKKISSRGLLVDPIPNSPI